MKSDRKPSSRKGCWKWAAVLLVGAAWAGTVRSQEAAAPAGAAGFSSGVVPPEVLAPLGLGAGNAVASAPAGGSPPAADLLQTGCSTCAGGLLGGLPAPSLGESAAVPPGPGPGGGCACGCGCGVPCHAGRVPCDCCPDDCSAAHRFFNGLYHCICCPDPCYVPAWVPLANAAFFVEPVRPVTQMRVRTDFAFNYQFPDKAEYFWARENFKGPNLPGVPRGTIAPGAPNLNYTEGFLYFEGAVQRFSLFVELAYLDVEPVLYPGAAGFGDMHVGAKTLLMDCELMQLTSFLEVYIPTGNYLKGLGTGHVAFEPALLSAVKITQRSYLQSEIAYWFPVGGTPTFQGPIFHTHWSLNHLLWNCGKDIQVIGTGEIGSYCIAGGAYTSPITGLPASAKDVTNIVNMGPGLRMSICNKFDFGAGSYFNVSRDRMAAFLGRLEIRYRF